MPYEDCGDPTCNGICSRPEHRVVGTISLPIPWADYHRGGHPWAFSYGQPDPCPCCGMPLAEQQRADEERQAALREQWAAAKAGH